MAISRCTRNSTIQSVGLWKSLRSLRFIDSKRKWAHTHIHTRTQHVHTQLCMGVGEVVELLCAALPFFYAQLTQLQVRHAAKQTQRPPATPSYTHIGGPPFPTHTHTQTHPAFIIITSQNICAQPCQNNAENVDECSGHSAPHARTHTNTDTHIQVLYVAYIQTSLGSSKRR